jgi:hypothetical protein
LPQPEKGLLANLGIALRARDLDPIRNGLILTPLCDMAMLLAALATIGIIRNRVLI